MKISKTQLKTLINQVIAEQAETGLGQQGRSELRIQQAASLVDSTNLKNAEAALKLLVRQAEGDISPDQKRYLNMLTGRTPKDLLKKVLDKLYVDGLNGKPLLGYRAMTPTKLRDLINSMKGVKDSLGDAEEASTDAEEVDADAEEVETRGKYQTQAMTGGASLEDIAKALGVSVQRAAELEKKAMERFKKVAGSKKGLETKESLTAFAVPAAKQFVALLKSQGVEDFIMDTLKLDRATEKDIEFLVDLSVLLEEDGEEEAAAEVIRLYLQGSQLPVIKRFEAALRAKETAGRPSKTPKFF